MNQDAFSGLSGRILTPCSPQYTEARQNWNRSIQQYPCIIVYCQTIQDVSNAVLWSKNHCVPMRIRNGGHNYEGFSNGTGTLIIDISEMNEIEINETDGLLSVLGGATNQQVYEYTAARGYPFPGGTCPTVGVCGYTLGGGWGLSCRNFGLGCDNVEEIHLIDADGCLLTASQTSNEDLFWACRGAGGGNFGVVVSVTFRLPPKTDTVTVIELEYLHRTEQEQKAFWGIWQNWLQQADNRMTLIARIYNSAQDGLAMLVRGIFYGTPQEAQIMLSGFLQADPTAANIQQVSFLQATQILGMGYPPDEMFSSFSRFATEYLQQDESDMLVQMIQQPPTGSVFTSISLYALGGRVAQVGVDDTAFFYRNAKYIIWLSTVWEDNCYAPEGREWIRNRWPAFSLMTEGCYVNFPYRELAHPLHEYFGDHTECLQCIDHKYDPYNIFYYPQGLDQCNPNEVRKYRPEDYESCSDETTVTQQLNHRGFRYITQGEQEPPA